MTAEHVRKKLRLTRIKGLQIKRGYHIEVSRQKKVKEHSHMLLVVFLMGAVFPKGNLMV